MTMEEIENSSVDILLATDVSEILQTCPNTLRLQAQTEPEKLGFPVIVCGERVKIPRMGFIYYMKYGRAVPY